MKYINDEYVGFVSEHFDIHFINDWKWWFSCIDWIQIQTERDEMACELWLKLFGIGVMIRYWYV